jgi:uncharacterized membrane protein
MSAHADATNRDVLFAESLRPSPPLPPKVLLIVLSIVAAINLAFIISFILQGAWPVAPFMGADVALLAWAFRQSTIAARREEHVTLTPDALRISRTPQRTETPDVALNPYWVRVEMGDPELPGSRLTLWSHGKAVGVGAFLAPFERAAFATRLKTALFRAKYPRG